MHMKYIPIYSNKCLSVSCAFSCVSSHTILDRFNIKNLDVTPNINSGLVQDFQRQDIPDSTADLLEFRRIKGLE